MAQRTSGQKILDDAGGGSGINWRDIMVNLSVDEKTTKVTRKLRLIGLPIEYWEASSRKKSPDDPSKTIQCDFPDKAQNKAWTRICQDDLSNDYWHQQGYIVTKRYAINCIDRDDNKVKILAKGKSIFKEFYKKERFNIEENIELAANGEPLNWTRIGGEEAGDVKIVANKVDNGWSSVEYEVHVRDKATRLTTEEIEKLRAVGQPTAEKLKEIRKANPDLDDVPDWYFYGYDLEKLFSPTPPRHLNGEEESTPVEEMEIDPTGDDDTGDEVEEEKVETKSTKKKSSVKEEEEEAKEEDVDW